MVGRLRLDPVADPDEFAALGIHRDVGPKVLLDQLWLRFDVLRVAFITVGQQHIKWGSNRFWNPTDFLNPVLLDPLAVFDVRTGVTMLKVHVPWEAKGWNFYAFGLLDNYDRASNLGRVGGAVRAEIVFGTAEVALSAVASPGFNPRFGADLSAGFGAIDFTVEAAVRDAGDEMRYRPAANPDPTAGQAGLFERYSASGIAPQVTLGFSRSILYSDQDSFAIGAEYFYNSLGYKGPADYVALLINGAFRPFYVGEHYAAVYLFVPNPGSWNDTTFVLSTLANLSDVSLVSRLDVLVTVLTHLRFEAYVAGHYGTRGGEFRLGAQIEPGSLCPTCAGVNFPPPLVEVGAALRMNL